MHLTDLLSKVTYSRAFRLYFWLGIEPTTFALLMQCSTTEPQEHFFWQVSCESDWCGYNLVSQSFLLVCAWQLNGGAQQYMSMTCVSHRMCSFGCDQRNVHVKHVWLCRLVQTPPEERKDACNSPALKTHHYAWQLRLHDSQSTQNEAARLRERNTLAVYQHPSSADDQHKV